MIKAIEYKFNGAVNDINSYDPDMLNVGSIIKQYTGPNPEDNFIGPAKIGLARPTEATVNVPAIYPHVYVYSQDVDWVFLADNATAAATRRIVLYEHNKNTSEFTWKGFITNLLPPVSTAHTIRGFRMSIEHYTTGTVSSSGTTITGSGTAWQASRLSVGSRIGFGSTDPTQISTWYEITAISGDTSLTVDVAPEIAPATPYVIQDMIAIMATTNATVANGGLFVSKGLRYELFTPAGTSISNAVSTDNIRACYWLADAAIVTNTTAAGCAIESMASWTEQNVYVLNVTGARVFKYNIRAALTLASGKATNALVLQTGNQVLTGTLSQTNNGRIVTASHGPGSGITSLYFVTTTRVYRCSLSAITAGSVTWTSDVMVEIPPGGTNTHAATSVLSSIEYSSLLDRFFVMTTGSAGARSYCTKYNTISDPFDHIFLIDSKQIDQSAADSGAPVHPSILALPFSVWIEGRVLYLARIGTTALNNHIYSLPVSAHQTYAFTTNQYIITPRFDISNANKLNTFYTRNIIRLGTDTFSLQTEPFRTYYRTSGITDNSGVWTLLNDAGDLSGIMSTEIQFAYTFKILGSTCIPARLISCTLTYEDLSTDSHYQPSLNKSSLSNRIFAYRQTTDWGGNIPTLEIRIHNADTNILVLSDTTTTETAGSFEYSTDGTNWNPWDNTQNTVGNYIRYTADSLPAGVKLKATILQG